jgi:putative Mn2+ efflux pump MntP
VAVVFGAFEVAMPLIGLAIGRSVSQDIGNAANWVGGGLLIAAGLYSLFAALRSTEGTGQTPISGARLLVVGLALSIDNLVVGFALGTYHVSAVAAAVVIGVVSVALSLVGLELGSRIGAWTGQWAEMIGSLALILVGAFVAASVL